jgi:hypothetical protein
VNPIAFYFGTLDGQIYTSTEARVAGDLLG